MQKQDNMTLRNDVAKQKKVIDLYRKFADGSFNKDALEDELARINAMQNAFDVKLKRVKVTKKVR